MIDVFVDQELKRDNPTGECFRVELCTNFHKKKGLNVTLLQKSASERVMLKF